MLAGNVVGLRAVEENDLSQFLLWRNRPEYRCYFREFRELGHAQQRQWFERVVLNDPNVLMFAIIELASGRLLGAAGLCYISWVNRNADFSIYIGAEDLYIDDHYALDAARVMARYAFDEVNLHRLWAEVYAFDERKIALFNTLGFSLDGRHRQTYWHDGRWHDSLFFSLLREEKLG